jgi:hypothetical protein
MGTEEIAATKGTKCAKQGFLFLRLLRLFAANKIVVACDEMHGYWPTAAAAPKANGRTG